MNSCFQSDLVKHYCDSQGIPETPSLSENIGIVIPTFNEQDSIADLLASIHYWAPLATIVIVDDSQDMQTANSVNKLNYKFVHLIKRSKKGGRGSAILEGLKFLIAEKKKIFIEMDADFSHPPRQIVQLVAIIESGSDLVIGSRYLSDSRIISWPWSRTIFSALANRLARSLLSVCVHDYTNGFRAYSHTAANHVAATCGKFGRGFISLSEILVQLAYGKSGLIIKEVPTIFINRTRGESSVNIREIWSAFIGLMLIYRLKGRLRRARKFD